MYSCLQQPSLGHAKQKGHSPRTALNRQLTVPKQIHTPFSVHAGRSLALLFGSLNSRSTLPAALLLLDASCMPHSARRDSLLPSPAHGLAAAAGVDDEPPAVFSSIRSSQLALSLPHSASPSSLPLPASQKYRIATSDTDSLPLLRLLPPNRPTLKGQRVGGAQLVRSTLLPLANSCVNYRESPAIPPQAPREMRSARHAELLPSDSFTRMARGRHVYGAKIESIGGEESEKSS